MDLRWLPAIRTGVYVRVASTYETTAAVAPHKLETNLMAHGHTERGRRVANAVAKPRLFRIGEDLATRQRWPMGPALLEMLGGLNSDVGEALAGERAWLREHGYPDDLPLPALWWAPRAQDELVEVADAPPARTTPAVAA